MLRWFRGRTRRTSIVKKGIRGRGEPALGRKHFDPRAVQREFARGRRDDVAEAAVIECGFVLQGKWEF